MLVDVPHSTRQMLAVGAHMLQPVDQRVIGAVAPTKSVHEVVVQRRVAGRQAREDAHPVYVNSQAEPRNERFGRSVAGQRLLLKTRTSPNKSRGDESLQ